MFIQRHSLRLFNLRTAVLLGSLVLPISGLAFSTGPPVNRTGAAIDGGLNCAACHRTFAPANTGSGKISISALTYTPGAKQNITITVEDPDANRWGYEITARLRSDETKPAGTFTPVASVTRVVCDPDGRAAPCNGSKEFATHVAATTQQGTKSKGTFTVEWTAPESDVGEVIFYFAGNAADGTGTNANDRIYTSSQVIRPVCNLTAKPTVSKTTDAAAFKNSISSGALITIFGTGFSSSRGIFQAADSDLVAGRLPMQLGCVAVEVAGKRAPIFIMNGTQVSVQAPQIDVAGNVNVVVITNPGTPTEQRSDVSTVAAAALSPAFFLLDGKNIAARNGSKNNGIVSIDGAASPGDIVVLYGTGFGPTNPALAPGEFATKETPITGSAVVTVGGVTVPATDVQYAGASGAAPGLYQFNVKLPASLPDGDAAVKVTIGGFSTQDGAVLQIKK
jgi:uncharacterized protein (TIGR03437 family)